MSDQPVTWTTLLAHWTAFAQASLALPRTDEGDRWRAAVPAIIGLHAITFALRDLDRLAPTEDRAAAQDRAAVGIDAHEQSLRALWRGQTLHDELEHLIAEARSELAASRTAGLEWRVLSDRLVVGHPADLVESLIAGGFRGDLFLPVPGTVLFRSSPAAFARAPGGARISEAHAAAIRGFLGSREVAEPVCVPGLRQVYRQFDFARGGVRRDLVLPESSPPQGGQAQLACAIRDGRAEPVTLPILGMAELAEVPVVFGE